MKFDSKVHKFIDAFLFLVPVIMFVVVTLIYCNNQMATNPGAPIDEIIGSIGSASDLLFGIFPDFGLKDFIMRTFGIAPGILPSIVFGFMVYGVWWAFLDLVYSVFKWFFELPKMLLNKFNGGKR